MFLILLQTFMSYASGVCLPAFWGVPIMGLGVWTFAAYCRNSLDGQWYSYDDSTVESLLEDEVITRGAYILFYQKRNSIPSWSASSSMRGRS